jgi:D-arabinose 1-dehydrogenase-like Zn-dependent alcohol dehydrogenase
VDQGVVTEPPAYADAVVLNEFNAPLKLQSGSVPAPGLGAIVAQVDLAGVCGTDLF